MADRLRDYKHIRRDPDRVATLLTHYADNLRDPLLAPAVPGRLLNLAAALRTREEIPWEPRTDTQASLSSPPSP